MSTKLTAEAVTAAIRDMNGNISAVAKRLGVCRQTVYSYIERHPSVKDVLAEARETMIDNAESALYRAVLNGEAWAVCFFLKTQGKSRGYVERQEVTGADGGAIVMQWPDEPRGT
jgi:hypothetical protein